MLLEVAGCQEASLHIFTGEKCRFTAASYAGSSEWNVLNELTTLVSPVILASQLWTSARAFLTTGKVHRGILLDNQF